MAPLGSLKRTISTDRDVSPPAVKRKVTTTTTSRAVANFFKPVSEKEPEEVTFRVLHDSLLVAQSEGSYVPAKPVRIAAFDLDDTLITTKSGNRFAKGEDDWKWWHVSVPARLKQLHEEGYMVVVMSNQAAVSLRSDSKVPKDMRSLANLKGKVSAVFKALDFPLTIYAATEKDNYRKPRTGMWEQMLKDHGHLNAGDVVKEGCIFVGDAAGREGSKTVRKDHSSCDRDLASNVGIPFKTPEEYFLNEEPKPFVRSFEPAPYVEDTLERGTKADAAVFAKVTPLDIVLFCGSPGGGKSSFYWRHLQPLGYARVNQDLLKTRDKCIKVATQLLEDDKQSVVVDNTNADIETRAAWVGLATRLQVPIRLVHFTAPAKLCEHNDTVRALSGGLMNPEQRTLLPKMAFTGFASRYREPRLEEGFRDITTIDFRFHGTEEQRAIWTKYWIS